MPSSDPITIPKVLSVVMAISPLSILDVGVGNGRYGFLFRECLDWNYGRIKPTTWDISIKGVEIETDYISPVHQYVYDHIEWGDWLNYPFTGTYDLVFMGDVLEHFAEGDWQKALVKAQKISKFTLIVCPNWAGSIHQGEWEGYENEDHKVVLSPEKVGGRCMFANSKMFMCVFDNGNTGLLEDKNICL